MKIDPIPEDISNPITNAPKLAQGWVYNEKRKSMFEYRDGIEINKHFCNNKYSHNVYECGKIDFNA